MMDPSEPLAIFSTIRIGESQYLLDHSKPAAQIPPFDEPERYIPATLIHWHQSNPSHDKLQKIAASFRLDDVWTKDFLKVLIYQKAKDVAFDTDADSKKTFFILQNHPLVPQGPYIIHSISGKIYPVFKLYHDSQNAFIRGTLPSNQTGVFKWPGSTNDIPVPSRLYSISQPGHKSLRGMRFAVKDSIDVAGLKTGCGNSSWSESHRPVTETAPFIRKLIDAGALLVGKTRLAPFCDGLDPLEITKEIVPVNPRGDEYQKPSSSSSGSASACASYPWLDFTIGTDTGGSIRHPAGVNGLYGMRPSIGSVQSKGLVCTSLMDTVGVFARSTTVLQLAMECIATDSSKKAAWRYDSIRFKLLYATESKDEPRKPTPKFFPFAADDSVNSSEAGRCFEEVISKLETYFGRERQRVCLYELWKERHPVDLSEDLTQATGFIYNTIVYRELYRNVIQPFDQAYRARNEGRAPFIESITKARLERASKVTDSEYIDAVHAKNTYASWVNETLLPNPFSDSQNQTNTETLEVPLLIYPQSWGVPQYRDEKMDSETDIHEQEFSVYSLSYCSGCPDVTVPVGEVRFESRISERDEYLPISLSILAPRGADQILLGLLSRLEEENILKGVKCGRRAFDR